MERTTSERKHARGALLFITGLVSTLVAAIALSSGSASAQVEPYNSTPPTVSPTRTGRINSPPPERNPLPDPQPPETLPFTGADLTLFLATGVAAVGTGAIVVRRTRPKKKNDKDES